MGKMFPLSCFPILQRKKEKRWFQSVYDFYVHSHIESISTLFKDNLKKAFTGAYKTTTLS
jgi:hypothetical protein